LWYSPKQINEDACKFWSEIIRDRANKRGHRKINVGPKNVRPTPHPAFFGPAGLSSQNININVN
jgi:hypothetical protein